ncbi:dimethylamine monooxygenase subunit DmmA family protein [Mycobacterium sp. NAZ190054]|uniref:dimethylamine monooxygenase subunit DmmA family protein n=1 Tax=Mycobacterium sp. NAZ190054 TaxID=1747766 RepID=UPI000791F1BD|nr:dimethylamine monooxygenase subunit DmmA family protein [Mycobacterium sp. NAZ190054]KWX66226.1 hypothetical protein ASJ79_06565 [Mycobacterium sp. NAZ190054]
MRPALELTSVPDWATAVTHPTADLTGRHWTIIAFGDAGVQVARRWGVEIADSGAEYNVRVHEIPDGDGAAGLACEALRGDLAEARVGWRLMMAGPASSCLKVRAEAVAAGVADDEMTVASTEVDRRAVECVHCRTVTVAAVELEDTVVCTGCDRNLFVHYHVSRRLGTHLGYMVDAEQQVAS